ncbi:hypothetical protein BCV69DRAFT_299643 [Microstroma glucosiphilum]|uniref:Uncharacterized protein n=1 Tax=Pseudomicrostroma glucosiphilum TaxID=1684307 RepID=A0A316U6B8_9BASI|nr:hypothetical protein BCV69DRAFT_299643 [Pseudomicrostroma glucosiphilum]PWN19883.1 hypothetical protein BCV69DRAFT_299643 [Pseudomicrostroma glucosiphilum]
MALSSLPGLPDWVLCATPRPPTTYSVLNRSSNGPYRRAQVVPLRLEDIQEIINTSSLPNATSPGLSPRKRSHTSIMAMTTMEQLSPLATAFPFLHSPTSPTTIREDFSEQHAAGASCSSAVNKNRFRPVDFQTQVEIERFFGQTRTQKRQLALHTKDEDGRWWFDGIEREENRSLLGAPSPSFPSSRRGSQQSSLPSTPNPVHGFDPYRRRSSAYLLGSLAPLQVCSPDRADFFQPHGILTDDPQEFGGDYDSGLEVPQRRTRMKRSHSASGRGNVIGDKLPDLSLSEALSTRDLDDAFQTVYESSGAVASASFLRNNASIKFADDTAGSRSRSNSGEARKDRPRPARLELTPRRGATGDLVEHSAYGETNNEAVTDFEGSSSSRITAKGTPVAAPMSPLSSKSSSSSCGISPISMRKRTRPWSAYEMSPTMVAQAFSAMRTNNGRLDGPATARSAFSFDSSPMRSTGLGSSSPFSATSAIDPPPGSRFRSSSLGSPNSKGGCFPSVPFSPCHGRRKGASSSLGLNAGTLEASKGEQRLGATPLNRNLLAPGGLATGEGVYDGLVIPCASVHLGSDDEDDHERKAALMRVGAAGGSRGVMKKWLTRKKGTVGALK